MDFTILIVLAALLLHTSDGSPVRMRRRSKPKEPQLQNLEQLRHECCGHGFLLCCEETRLLQNPNSTVNTDFQECLDDVRQTNQIPIVINPLFSENTVPPPDDSAPTDCPLRKAQKTEARDYYCDLLSYADVLVTTNIFHLQTSNRCVDYFDHPDYQTPDEMLTGIKNWQTSMVERHHCCTNFNKDPKPWENSVPARHHHRECTAYETHVATKQWDANLTIFAQVMRMVEMLERFGTRRSCLRGCVCIDEVDCANIL